MSINDSKNGESEAPFFIIVLVGLLLWCFISYVFAPPKGHIIREACPKVPSYEKTVLSKEELLDKYSILGIGSDYICTKDARRLHFKNHSLLYGAAVVWTIVSLVVIAIEKNN